MCLFIVIMNNRRKKESPKKATEANGDDPPDKGQDPLRQLQSEAADSQDAEASDRAQRLF